MSTKTKKRKDNQKQKHKKDITKLKSKKTKTLPAEISITSESKCDQCVQSLCCTYVTQQIDAPKSMGDFDYLYWQLSHKNIHAFKDEDGWFLSFLTPCIHLLPKGGACGIYDKRPKICRKHSNESCEFDGPAEDDFKLFFDSHESLDKYCRKRFKNWNKRFKKWAG